MSEANLPSGRQRVALVTGATGFVGMHLALRLVNDGWQVHNVCRAGSRMPFMPEFSQITNHIHDGSSQGMVDCVAQIKPDVVFHLASMFLSQHEAKDIEPLILSNVLFGNQLLEALKVNHVNHIINTGTSWQHYNNENYNPVCLYAATKQAFEVILEFYVQASGIKAITLKLFDTYGPNDNRPKLFYLLNKAAASGETLKMSEGDQLIDLVYIDDVIEAFAIAAQRLIDGQVSQHECYAVSSGHPIPLRELVHLYAKVRKQSIPVNWGARPYRFREVMNTWSCGVKLSGWNPKMSLENGIKKTLNIF
jgi:nucleoside-diphosphate-sugar epimerase